MHVLTDTHNSKLTGNCIQGAFRQKLRFCRIRNDSGTTFRRSSATFKGDKYIFYLVVDEKFMGKSYQIVHDSLSASACLVINAMLQAKYIKQPINVTPDQSQPPIWRVNKSQFWPAGLRQNPPCQSISRKCHHRYNTSTQCNCCNRRRRRCSSCSGKADRPRGVSSLSVRVAELPEPNRKCSCFVSVAAGSTFNWWLQKKRLQGKKKKKNNSKKVHYYSHI